MVEPPGRLSGVGSVPLGSYEASGFAQVLGFAGEELVVGWGLGDSDGNGVGV
jgi:hypothetical protein